MSADPTPAHTPASAALAQHAMRAFDTMVQRSAAFTPRAGQQAMAQRIADTLSRADLGECENPTQAIAVVQAGTGVGKSAAYASTAVALALARKTRVIVSTATVALQEQLMQKDLPALAQTMDEPFVYALAKGRGLYSRAAVQILAERMNTPLCPAGCGGATKQQV